LNCVHKWVRYAFFNTVREKSAVQTGGGDLLTQTIVLAQQPPAQVSVNIPIPYQTVKAEVYEPITRKLESKWERDYFNDQYDG